jgi:hypothetical protein
LQQATTESCEQEEMIKWSCYTVSEAAGVSEVLNHLLICSRLDQQQQQQQQQLVRPAARTSYKIIINADDQTSKPFWSSAGMSFRPELSSS